MNKNKNIVSALAVAFIALSSLSALAQKKDPDVGGAPMFATKTIVENAAASPIHTTLVAAVKAADLVDTLNAPGPFTLFAPTNDAFGKLPAGTVDTLLKPENKQTLIAILTYHVVPGKISEQMLARAIKKGGGSYKAETVDKGHFLTFASPASGVITITDEKGGISTVTTADVYQKNGIIHVVDSVLQPN